jgi:pimeloyl-ACP methyl ester carboxylesterase
MIYRFGQCELDTERLELRRDGELQAVEPQVFSLLVHLIENREQVVSKDALIAAVWDGRIVSDATLGSRINAARRAVGDTGKDQAVIKTAPRRGFRFVANVEANDQRSDVRPLQKTESLHQDVRFCMAPDGVQISYSAVGAGPPLVKTANWLNHLEYDWESPLWRHALHALAAQNCLVRYDQRGNGLSDWDVDDISFDAWVTDLEAVVDAAGLETFSILGLSQGCSVAVAYAVRHPERVSSLVLHGGYTRGRNKRGQALLDDQEAAMVDLIRTGWGQANPAFRQVFTSLICPDANQEQMDAFNEMQLRSTTPDNAVRIRDTTNHIEVSDLATQVTVPTLVTHARDDGTVPFEEGRRLAASIPGATFLPLESRNHLILEHEPAWPKFIGEVNTFLQANQPTG